MRVDRAHLAHAVRRAGPVVASAASEAQGDQSGNGNRAAVEQQLNVGVRGMREHALQSGLIRRHEG